MRPFAYSLCLICAPTAALALQQPDAAVRVEVRYDRVSDAYREVVDRPISPTAVLAIQEALAARGYEAGLPTGVLDRRVRSAIRRFQIDQGLRITAYPDAQTLRSLGIIVDTSAPVTIMAAPVTAPRRATTILVIGPGGPGPRGGRAVVPEAGEGEESVTPLAAASSGVPVARAGR